MIVAPPRTALAVLVLASLALSSGGLLAQAVPQSALAPTERDLVRGAAVLAKRAVGPVRSATLPAYFGTGPSQAQYDAQFGEPFTVGELLGHLPRMVDNGKIRVDSIRARTRTYLAQGQDADTIVVASRLLDRASTGSAGLPAAYWGLTLAAALATEVTHVFQIPLLGAASQCDAARDADGLGLLVLDGFLAALRAPGGTPHASFAAMDADGDAIVGLTAFLGSGGVADAPGDIAALAEALARRRKGRALRRTLALGDPAWTSSYYGSGAQSGLDDAAATDAATRAKSTMTDVSGLVVRDLVVPAPGLLTQTTVFLNDLDETVAISAYFDAGAHHLRFWRDTDGDGLPEAAPAATDVTLPGAFSDPGLHGVSLHPTLPPALTNAGTDRGLLLHDRASGAVFALELGVDGLPAAAPLALFSHVKFTDAQGFVHLNHVTSVGTADIGFVFSSQPIVADAGANQATRIVLVGPNPTTGGSPASPLTDFSGRLFGGHPTPGLDRMDRRSGFVVAHGFEFDFLNLMLPGSAGNTTQGGSSISSFGYGLPTFVNWTPPSPQNAAIGTHAFLNSLFGATGEVFFAPALGRWLGSTLGDEDGDGAIDRLDLVGNPPQLVYSSGLASQPTGPAKQHRYQLVLEATDPIAIYSGWTSGARVVSAADRDLVFTRITGTSPPLYAQSLRDLVPDADPDEAIVLRRVAGQSSFVLRVYDDVDGTPFILQSITLPGGYVPREIAYADADADGDLDLSCCEATTGEVLRFVNGGAGTFTMLQGPLHPGTQEDFRWEFRINGVPPAACDIVPVAAGDIVEILIDSPMGTFDGTPLVLLGQYFTPGFPPAGVPAFGAAVSPGGSPAPFVIFDGSQPGPFGGPSVPLPPGGSQHAFLVPPGFVGISIMTQVLALTPTAANGFFASSHGVELRAP